MTWLDNARIMATFAVIFLHVSAGFVTSNQIGSEYWWVANVIDSAARWCVPVFVMISGALLLDPNKQETLAEFYTKRLSKILLPLLFWSAFFLVWVHYKIEFSGGDITLFTLFKILLSGKPYYHMWFLYMIISLYLFTPFFRKIVTHSSNAELLGLIAITFALAAFNHAYGKFISGGSTLFTNWFFLYIPFFFLGYYIRQDNRKPAKAILWLVFITSIILTFVGCYLLAKKTTLANGLYFYGYLSVTVIPMSISIMYIFKSWEKPFYNLKIVKQLSALTLGIYLVHPTLLEVINSSLIGTNNIHPIVLIPLVSFLVFVTTSCIAFVIKKTPFIRHVI